MARKHAACCRFTKRQLLVLRAMCMGHENNSETEAQIRPFLALRVKVEDALQSGFGWGA